MAGNERGSVTTHVVHTVMLPWEGRWPGHLVRDGTPTALTHGFAR
jgi:hypothetical protein